MIVELAFNGVVPLARSKEGGSLSLKAFTSGAMEVPSVLYLRGELRAAAAATAAASDAIVPVTVNRRRQKFANNAEGLRAITWGSALGALNGRFGVNTEYRRPLIVTERRGKGVSQPQSEDEPCSWEKRPKETKRKR